MKISEKIVKGRVLILIISIALMIPCVIGMAKTRINYDLLTYLPDSIETVKGQDELSKEFGKGAFAFIVTDDMTDEEVKALHDEIEQVDSVDSVLWYSSIADLTMPIQALPDEVYKLFNKGDSSLIAIFFSTGTSADETLTAVDEIRHLCDKKAQFAGLSAMVLDLKQLCETQEPIYVAIAVALSLLVMMIFLDNFMVPFLFLGSIGLAILYNLGSNYFLGEISFITKCLSAVLQLAVTMDYSIFLWHRFCEEKEKESDSKKAMTRAIHETFSSVLGSSITTFAGFVALMFMTFTLGKDLGIVMAKGVVIGVIGCVTVLPSLILVLEKPLMKCRHKTLLKNMDKVSNGIIKRFPIFLIVFLLIIPPAFYGYKKCNNETYYNLAQGLPKYLPFQKANDALSDNFDILSTHLLLISTDTSEKDTRDMLDEMKEVDGVKNVIGLETLVGNTIPKEFLPEKVVNMLESGKWELALINSEYKAATDDVNDQITKLNKIRETYDKNGMLIGEACSMKDMLSTMGNDFKMVNAVSIILVFIIIFFVTQSVTLPVILIAIIELAIFINFAISHFTGVALPFIAPVCVSTIQLGACVDYAILMTTRYRQERIRGQHKKNAVKIALSTSMPSIIVSSLGLFAATFGVYLYCNVDMINSICLLLARGALISVICVILFLPSMLMFADRFICKTTLKMTHIYKKERMQKND